MPIAGVDHEDITSTALNSFLVEELTDSVKQKKKLLPQYRTQLRMRVFFFFYGLDERFTNTQKVGL